MADVTSKGLPFPNKLICVAVYEVRTYGTLFTRGTLQTLGSRVGVARVLLLRGITLRRSYEETTVSYALARGRQ